jgi:hypothetical protein
MMMKITVREPKSEIELELEARPAVHGTLAGWEVAVPEGKPVWVTDKDGHWITDTERADLDKKFIQAIGEAIKPPHTAGPAA